MKLNFPFHLKIKVPKSIGRMERNRIKISQSFHSDDLGCHIIYWCWSIVFMKFKVNAVVHQEIFRTFHASIWWQALWKCWFSFPAELGTCLQCQNYLQLVCLPWYYCVWLANHLVWPELHRKTIGHCQVEEKRYQIQQYRGAEGHYESNLGFHNTSVVPHVEHLHMMLHWSSNLYKRRPNQVPNTKRMSCILWS